MIDVLARRQLLLLRPQSSFDGAKVHVKLLWTKLLPEAATQRAAPPQLQLASCVGELDSSAVNELSSQTNSSPHSSSLTIHARRQPGFDVPPRTPQTCPPCSKGDEWSDGCHDHGLFVSTAAFSARQGSNVYDRRQTIRPKLSLVRP